MLSNILVQKKYNKKFLIKLSKKLIVFNFYCSSTFWEIQTLLAFSLNKMSDLSAVSFQ